METTLDLLASAGLTNEDLTINGETLPFIRLTLRYTRVPGPSHHELQPLLLTQDQARTLAQGLLVVADRVRATGATGPGAAMQ